MLPTKSAALKREERIACAMVFGVFFAACLNQFLEESGFQAPASSSFLAFTQIMSKLVLCMGTFGAVAAYGPEFFSQRLAKNVPGASALIGAYTDSILPPRF